MADEEPESVGPRHLELLTPRLHLVRLGHQHLDDLVALDADPEVMRYLPTNAPNTRERYVEELLPRMSAWQDRAYGFLAAYEAGAFVGWFHLRPSVADAGILELGYRLRRAAWGRGLATEGSRALLRHAFETLAEPCVDACTMPENAASIAVMRKCGMRYAGDFLHPRMDTRVVRYMVRRADVNLGDTPAR
jgi:RimJ/RimL family protein N-acetyltransferase